MIEAKNKTMFFTSNRAEAMTNKVNDWIEENINSNVCASIEKIEHGISYSDSRGYMMSCMIYYRVVRFVFKEEEDDVEKSEENNK